MISIEELTSNIDNLDIIDPFSFKYIAPSLKDCSTLKLNMIVDKYPISYFISIDNYLKILYKIFNNNRNICFLCKRINESNFCCNLCHEWFCDLCTKLHSKEDPLHFENLKKFDKYYPNGSFMEFINKKFKRLFDMKFLTLDNIPKNWQICECENGGGEVITYCYHGLRCKNCIYSISRLW